jgi:aspartyl-tRNA(Asn)/glutamyl-tRNA(Gln) amidotransferase subunit C
MLTEDEIKKIANLARLELTPQEVSLYTKQLGTIVEYISQLSKVDTTDVVPMVTPTDMTPHYRVDEVKPGLGGEAVTANAPEKSGNLFKVPAVL